MSGREWKPGAAAILGCHDTNCPVAEHPAILGRTGEWWLLDRGEYLLSHAAEPIRPLVVIDVESREQVERLRQSLRKQGVLPSDESDHWRFQRGLREFANPTPPKPEEPTGLYARVEDAKGAVWVRTATQASVWRRECVNSAGKRYLIPQDGCEDYDDVAVVRVLSEGVSS